MGVGSLAIRKVNSILKKAELDTRAFMWPSHLQWPTWQLSWFSLGELGEYGELGEWRSHSQSYHPLHSDSTIDLQDTVS